MGSLEQQMALFEELISQEAPPSNGLMVRPPGLMMGVRPVMVPRMLNAAQVVQQQALGQHMQQQQHLQQLHQQQQIQQSRQIQQHQQIQQQAQIQQLHQQQAQQIHRIQEHHKAQQAEVEEDKMMAAAAAILRQNNLVPDPLDVSIRQAREESSEPSLQSIPLPNPPHQPSPPAHSSPLLQSIPLPSQPPPDRPSPPMHPSSSHQGFNQHAEHTHHARTMPADWNKPPDKRARSSTPPPGIEDHDERSHKGPRLYEKESESLELRAAIAKATAAANATNSQRYPTPFAGAEGGQRYPGPRGPRPPMHRYPPGGPLPMRPGMRPGMRPEMRPPGPGMRPPAPPARPRPPGMENASQEQMAMFFAAAQQQAAQHAIGGAEVAGVTGEEALPKNKKKREKKDKRIVRTAAGEVWEDNSLMEWDNNDFRIFVGDIGNECNDEMLYRAFSKYQSLTKVKVIRDKRSNKTKGYGFASFKDANDYIKAMREVNGKYIGNRPCKLRKSSWKDRQLAEVKKKNNEKKKLGLKV